MSEYCTHSSYIVKHRLHVWARRRERNKIAAEKCRNKRKKAVERLYSESELVAVQNTRLVLCSAPSVPQPVVQSRRRPLLGPSPG